MIYGILVAIFSLAYIFYVIYSPSSKARHWSSIPGFCMGVGIFFTFVSLFLIFRRNGNGDNISELMKEVSSAFLGSLVGLFFSLIMTYKIKSKISEIEEEEQKKAGENANPYLLLQQIVENTGSNKAELEKLNTAFSTFNSTTEQFNTNLFEELIQKLEKVVKDTGSNAIKQSLQNLDGINTQLSGKLGEIEGIVSGFGNNISIEIEKVLAAKIQNLEATFERIEKYQTRSQTALETTTKSFKETVEKYEKVNENKTELIDNIKLQLKELKAVRENGSTLIQNWNDIAKSMENMQDRINQINGVITQLDNTKTILTTQQNLNNDVQ